MPIDHDTLLLLADAQHFLPHLPLHAQIIPNEKDDKMPTGRKRKAQDAGKSSCCGLNCVLTLLLRPQLSHCACSCRNKDNLLHAAYTRRRAKRTDAVDEKKSPGHAGAWPGAQERSALFSGETTETGRNSIGRRLPFSDHPTRAQRAGIRAALSTRDGSADAPDPAAACGCA